MAEAVALSEAVRPLKPNGSLDAEVAARLAVRHDDSPENVTTRLAVWDRQVSCRIPKNELASRINRIEHPCQCFELCLNADWHGALNVLLQAQ
jgi:hypothetical protein